MLSVSFSLLPRSLHSTELAGWLCSEFVRHIHHCHPSRRDNIFLHWLRTLLIFIWGNRGRGGGMVLEDGEGVGRWGFKGEGGGLSEFFHCFQLMEVHSNAVPSCSPHFPFNTLLLTMVTFHRKSLSGTEPSTKPVRSCWTTPVKQHNDWKSKLNVDVEQLSCFSAFQHFLWFFVIPALLGLNQLSKWHECWLVIHFQNCFIQTWFNGRIQKNTTEKFAMQIRCNRLKGCISSNSFLIWSILTFILEVWMQILKDCLDQTSRNNFTLCQCSLIGIALHISACAFLLQYLFPNERKEQLKWYP